MGIGCDVVGLMAKAVWVGGMSVRRLCGWLGGGLLGLLVGEGITPKEGDRVTGNTIFGINNVIVYLCSYGKKTNARLK